MASAEVRVIGEQAVRRRFLTTAGRLTNLRPAFTHIAQTLRQAARQQFDSSGAYGGQPWEALRPNTLAKKRRAGLDPRVLRATHTLEQSYTADGAGHVQEVTDTMLRWGSNVHYGRFVARRRPPFRLPPSGRRQVITELGRAIFGRL